MSWPEDYRSRLTEELECHGELAPPWVRYPQYDRYSIGWRMGPGEDWMLLWRLFLEDLAADFETRRDYLLGHAPAPALWADWVDQVLYPDRPFGSLEPDSPEGRERCARLTALGLLQE